MIFKKKTASAERYQRKRNRHRVLFVFLCLLLFVLGFFAAGPILSALGL